MIEEKLKEAHVRYPKGTKFKSMGSLKHTIVSTGVFKIAAVNKSSISMNDLDGHYVYQNGEWAELLIGGEHG